jgi:hypothetical protein
MKYFLRSPFLLVLFTVLLFYCYFSSNIAYSTEKEITQQSCLGDISVYPGSFNGIDLPYEWWRSQCLYHQ